MQKRNDDNEQMRNNERNKIKNKKRPGESELIWNKCALR